jgi:hypothetical protein
VALVTIDGGFSTPSALGHPHGDLQDQAWMPTTFSDFKARQANMSLQEQQLRVGFPSVLSQLNQILGWTWATLRSTSDTTQDCPMGRLKDWDSFSAL